MHEPQVTSRRSVAIVGSGPSGCYTAGALRKLAPATEVVVLDALPTPYGLVRHGIAPDHQGMKAVTRQFDRVFADDWARFVGGVHIGRDLTLTELTELFDVVVLATGLPTDRSIAVTGGALPGVYGAGEVIHLLNGHPSARLRAAGMLPQHGLGAAVAVVGTGNVAIDVVRLLSKDDQELHGSDIDDDARDTLGAHRIQRVEILGRGPASAAKWDASMLHELAGVSTVALTVDGDVVAAAKSGQGRPPVTVNVRFNFALDQITAAPSGQLTLHPAGSEDAVTVNSVIGAIGFTPSTDPSDMHEPHDRVHRVGGCDSGVLGNLAQNRKAAQAAAAAVATTLAEMPASTRPGWAGLTAKLPLQTVDHRGWRRIDAAEVARALYGRTRRKFTSHDELLDAATTGDGR